MVCKTHSKQVLNGFYTPSFLCGYEIKYPCFSLTIFPEIPTYAIIPKLYFLLAPTMGLGQSAPLRFGYTDNAAAKRTTIRNADVYTGSNRHKPHTDVTFDSQGNILKVKRAILGRLPGNWKQRLHKPNESIIDAKNRPLTTGLIEQHFHGGLGVNLNTSTVEDMKKLVDYFPSIGVTQIVPTVMTDTEENMTRALENLEKLIQATRKDPAGAQIISIHIEGPFINTQKSGAHKKDHIDTANEQKLPLLQRLLDVAPDLKLVTLAPELDPEGEMTQFLINKGIRVSAGHTMASAEELNAAFGHGVTGMTHTFNAMPGISHRPGQTGPIIPGAQNPKMFLELITDGHHVDPELVKFMFSTNANIIPVSDCSPVAGLPEGQTSEMGGLTVENKGGKTVNSDGTLVGCAKFLPDCVRNLVDWEIFNNFGSAVAYSAKNTAAFLGLDQAADKKMGEIKKGHQANLVLWNKEGTEADMTWVNGNKSPKLPAPKIAAYA